MAGKREARQLYWQDILNQQATSGLSIRKFCDQKRISQPSFYMWRRRLGAPKATRLATATRHESDLATGEFIPLTLLEDSGTLEVIHPCGCRVRVTGEVNTAALECILSVLDQRQTR